jgi:hypothetical protein
MKKITLTKNKIALVDDEDFERVDKYNWSYLQGGYAVRSVVVGHRGLDLPLGDSRNQIMKMIFMHRFILGIDGIISVDHIDGNKLNNQKSNLRVATKSQNAMNSKIRNDNTSGHKGVNWSKVHHTWVARVKVSGKEVYSRNFNTLEEAIEARDGAVMKYHKEFSKLG